MIIPFYFNIFISISNLKRRILELLKNRNFIFIGNIENRLENLSLSSILFASETILSQFRNLNFRVLSRVIYHIFE